MLAALLFSWNGLQRFIPPILDVITYQVPGTFLPTCPWRSNENRKYFCSTCYSEARASMSAGVEGERVARAARRFCPCSRLVQQGTGGFSPRTVCSTLTREADARSYSSRRCISHEMKKYHRTCLFECVFALLEQRAPRLHGGQCHTNQADGTSHAIFLFV